MSVMTMDRMLLSKCGNKEARYGFPTYYVRLNTSMSEQQIQSAIDAVPRTLIGSATVFQFADGTYNLVGPLTFNGFRNQYVYPYGNMTETGPHINQAVHLNFSSGSGLVFVDCNVYSLNLRVSFVSSSANSYGVKFVNCSNGGFHTSYIAGSGATNGECVRVEGGMAYCYQTTFANAYYGMRANKVSFVYSYNCATTTPALNTVFYSEGASQISTGSRSLIVNYTTLNATATAGRVFNG